MASKDVASSESGSESDCDAPGPSKKAKSSTAGGHFKTSWKLPVGIESSRKGSKYAYCKLCLSHFKVAHGGFNDITRHVGGTGHLQRLKDTQCTASLKNMLGSSSASAKLTHSRRVTSAEVMMCKFVAMHNLSFQATDHLSSLMREMFPDSKIAADFGCKHTKTKTDVLDPHYKKPVIENVRTSPYSLLCDESNDRGDLVKLLTVLVRAYEPSNNKIRTRHLDTVGISDLTAEGIFNSLEEVIVKHGLDFGKIVSFASDTCNVMKGARNGVIAKLRAKQPKIIDIHCICHLVSLVVKSAVKTLPIKIDDLLVDIYYHFHRSVKRVSSLSEYSNFCDVEFKAILKHCETRWLSLTRALQRTLEMWEPLCSYFNSHAEVEDLGKVRSIASLLNKPSTKLWIKFLLNTLTIFDKYNKLFQTSDTSTIYKLHAASERLLKIVLSFFVKPEVIRRNSHNLTGINVSNTADHLQDEELFIGDETSALLMHLQENEGEPIGTFYKSVKNFHQTFVRKLKEKFDFKSDVFNLLKLLDPGECQNIPLTTFDKIQDIFPIHFDKPAVTIEFREFSVDSDIYTAEQDAVIFWLRVKGIKSAMGDYKYSNIATLALHLLSIPASNADSERVFSLVRRIKTDFRSRLLPETVSALVGIHFNTLDTCCERSVFETSLLDKAKSCTYERNKS